MFNPKNDNDTSDKHGAVNALLGRGSEFEGKLVFEGTVRIDGKFKGEIVSNDKLVIGETAEVEAEIQVDTLIVSGNVTGNLNAKGRIELQPPAKVFGNIISPSVVISEGVMFDGTCRMSQRDHVKRVPLDRDEADKEYVAKDSVIQLKLQAKKSVADQREL